MATEILTDVEIRNAKPSDKQRKLRDGNGLIVLVHPNGSKYFQLRTPCMARKNYCSLGAMVT